MSGPTATVAGVTAPIESATLDIMEAIRERSIARFTVQDQAGASAYKRGDAVAILDSAASVLYRGYVWNDSITRLVSTGETRHRIVATDNTYLVDKRIIAAAYSAQTLRQIVTDLINDKLNEEGIAAWTHQWLELDGAGDFAQTDLDPGLTTAATWIFGLRAADYSPGTGEILAAQWGGGDSAWFIRLLASGRLNLAYSTTGTDEINRFSTVTLPAAIAGLTDGVTDVWVKIEFEGDNGASGHDVRFYWTTTHPANPYEDTPTDWTQLGTTVTTAGTVTLRNTARTMVFGALQTAGANSFEGRLYRAELYDDATATNLIADPHFDQLPEWDIGDTASTDSLGNTWTLKPTSTEPVIDRTWTVDVGPTVTIVFNYITAYQAIDLLAERAQFWWNVDHDKILRFHDRAENVAPFAVDEANILKNTDAVEHDHPNYRNTQYIRGGFDTTASQVEVFAGDGERITFTVGFPIAEVPTVETNIASAGYTTKTVGIRGIDTGKDFYWNKASNEILQDSGGTTLTTSDLLRVTYIGLVDLVVKSFDDAEIFDQASREGGSGIVEAVLEDVNIQGRTEAFAAAADLLAQFGNTLPRALFAVDATGLEPGQLVDTSLPQHGIANNTDLIIERVQMQHRGADRYIWSVTAVEGPPERSWSEFFRMLSEQAGRIPAENISEIETVTILETISETTTITEIVTASVYACPVPSTTLFPSTSLLPC